MNSNHSGMRAELSKSNYAPFDKLRAQRDCSGRKEDGSGEQSDCSGGQRDRYRGYWLSGYVGAGGTLVGAIGGAAG